MIQIPPGATLHDLQGIDHPLTVGMSMLEYTLGRHRRTPIERLGTEALRFLLEEGQAAEYLLPVAIDRLERDPFLGGDHHPGDLLVAVLSQPMGFFREHHELRARAFLVATDAEELIDLLEPVDRTIVANAIRAFMGGVGSRE